MATFKAVRLLSPTLVVQIQPTAADIDHLKILPFLSTTTIEHLKEELPTYLVKASALASSSDGGDSSMDSLEW